jgi:hypothetical protein
MYLWISGFLPSANARLPFLLLFWCSTNFFIFPLRIIKVHFFLMYSFHSFLCAYLATVVICLLLPRLQIVPNEVLSLIIYFLTFFCHHNILYRPSDRRLSAKLVPTFADRGCRVVSATDPHGRILGFLDPEPLLFHSRAPQLYSRGWVDPVPDPLLLRKSGRAGNRTQDLWPLVRLWTKATEFSFFISYHNTRTFSV